jgi:membrane protein DedA with SNARE-associated domain
MFLIQFIDSVENWVIALFHHQPLIGPVLLLIAEEAGIPLPVPGDVYIAYTGYQVSKKVITYPLALSFLMIAVLIGSSTLYYISSRFGKSVVLQFGKYIHLNQSKLNFIENKFRKFGPFVIIIGRHIPGFRIPVTVFSGLSKVPYKTFILSEFISVLFWIVLFLQLGAKLGRKTLLLFHNHYAFLLLLIIPVTLTLVTFLFGKFIPEE